MKKVLGTAGLVLLSAALSTGCGKSDGDGGGGGGTPGSGRISMKGGNGNVGGAGRPWQMQTFQARGVKISRTGAADTGFRVPSYGPPVDLGANGATVSTNTTVQVLTADVADSTAGTLYLYTSDFRLYLGTGTGSVLEAEKQVTGLRVDAGVTLTLGLNLSAGGNDGLDLAYLYFPNDVDIAGTLRTADLSTTVSDTTPDGTVRDMGGLRLNTSTQLLVRSTGSIITRGANGAASSNADGGRGGYLYLYSAGYFVNAGTIDCSGGNGDGIGNGGPACVHSGVDDGLYVYVNDGIDPSGIGGVFINRGRITGNGGDGANGGIPAHVYLRANSHVFNTGSITSNGGTGSTGTGGNGEQYVHVYSGYASIYNSGAISQRGGDGATGGGAGGHVHMSAAYDPDHSGELLSSGDITTSGGDCTGTGDCVGGGGGYAFLYASGAIKTSGDITMNGGYSHGAVSGGTGGYLHVENFVGRDYVDGNPLPVGDIQISGNISLNGGNGGAAATGGAGGSFYVYQAPNGGAAADTGISLLGYASADLSGGDGTIQGGDAGSSFIYTYSDTDPVAVPPGPITNEIAITGKGGNGTGAASRGGTGMNVSWETRGGPYAVGGVSVLTNRGAIDVSGGSGGTGGGGHSNRIAWYGHDGVVNSGDLTSRGGASAGGTGGNGANSGIWISATLDLESSGTIDTTGGSGDVGGNGSNWAGGPFGSWVQLLAGGQVRNTGSIRCNGGAGVTTNGNGGGLEIFSEKVGSVTGAMSVAAGAGAGEPGIAGQAWVDGVWML